MRGIDMKGRTLLPLLFLCVLLCACAAQREGTASDASAAESSAPSELDLFYENPLTEPYGDIRTLPEDYTAEQAQADRCFVIGAMVHNDDLYADFMAGVEAHEDAFIRVVQTTVEGDPILCDILYDSAADKVLLVNDATRDAFGGDESDAIALQTFEHILEYDDGQHQYWVACNGEPDLESEDTFLIAVIN